MCERETWRNSRGQLIYVERREPEVIYDAFSENGTYVGPVKATILRKNGYQPITEPSA